MAATKTKQIISLLSVKHNGDVFVTECKNGPGPALRIDAWAMEKSWVKPHVHGYEVKASRADFLKDNKMVLYMPMCNFISIVCPWGMIKPEELPDRFGLFYVTKTGTRLYTKVKPPYRDVTIPENVFRYILMARVKITRESIYDVRKGAEYWKDWLEQKEEHRALGAEVRLQMTKLATAKIFEIERENGRLKFENEGLEDTKKLLKEMGIDSGRQVWITRRTIENLGPKGLLPSVESAIKKLQAFQEKVESYDKDRKE